MPRQIISIKQARWEHEANTTSQVLLLTRSVPIPLIYANGLADFLHTLSALLISHSVRAHTTQPHNLPKLLSARSRKMKPSLCGNPLMSSWSPFSLKWCKNCYRYLSEKGICKMVHDNTKEFPKALQNHCWNTRKEMTIHSCFRDLALALWTKHMSVYALYQQHILCQTTVSSLFFYTCNTEEIKCLDKSLLSHAMPFSSVFRQVLFPGIVWNTPSCKAKNSQPYG